MRYADPRYPLVKIRELASFVQYGISKRANTDGLGIPMIRMNNLQPLGWDFSDLKHIELSRSDLTKYRLERGDILFNRTNSKELVGKCEVFAESGDWVFASYLIRARLDPTLALPEFVSAFLNTDAGRMQIDQVSRQIAGMSNVNAEELRDLEVPLPASISEQRRLVGEFLDQLDQRDRNLADAERLLASIDEVIRSELNLPTLPPSQLGGYGVRRADIVSSSNLAADYHHPERVLALKTISAVPNDRLAGLVTFERTTHKDPGSARYIGLASVASDTGQLTGVAEEAGGQCFGFEKGDVLYGRLRPYLNKVWAASFDGVCSKEFHVLRPISPDQLSSEYLAIVMRTGLIVSQTKHMMTGNTHPRIANADVGNLLIPLADARLQMRIVGLARERETEALRLQQEAHHTWQKARTELENQLLGEIAK